MLFVSQYVRVGLAVPLIFCHQSDQVIEKRKKLMKMSRYAEILWAIYMVVILLLIIVGVHEIWVILSLWELQISLLTVLLCLAL